jgi:hypothetical protein
MDEIITNAMLDALCDVLRAEPNAEAYAGDAADMLKNGDDHGSEVADAAEEDGDEIIGDDPTTGPMEIISCVGSELDCVGDWASEEGTAACLEDIVSACTRAAHLLLHAAIEARRRMIRRAPQHAPQPADDRQLTLPGAT